MAGATTGKEALFSTPMRKRASMRPQTVPNKPMNGAAEAMLDNVGMSAIVRCCSVAIATEQQRTMALMPTLSSIASAAPFIGLFGTVWGLMDALLRIGVEKSASLPVVAPAIGEALIATAFGLVAAIPATIGFNYVDKRIGDLLDELTASAEVWVETLIADPSDARGRG